MTLFSVNLLAVLLGGVANMVIGMLWYSPFLFGNQWIKYMGLTPKKLESMKTNMALTYGLSFVGALLQAFVLGYFYILTASIGVTDGLILGGLAWLGFVAVTQLTSVLYEQNKSLGLFAINTGYQLVSLLAMGAILGYLS